MQQSFGLALNRATYNIFLNRVEHLPKAVFFLETEIGCRVCWTRNWSHIADHNLLLVLVIDFEKSLQLHHFEFELDRDETWQGYFSKNSASIDGIRFSIF